MSPESMISMVGLGIQSPRVLPSNAVGGKLTSLEAQEQVSDVERILFPVGRCFPTFAVILDRMESQHRLSDSTTCSQYVLRELAICKYLKSPLSSWSYT
jgi:hypothetical protein